jgi:hypothetical protein
LFGKKKSDLRKSDWDSHTIENYITKDELKEKIGIIELKKMYDVIDVDVLWLERMIKNERGLVSQRILNKHKKEISKHKKTISDLELKISKMSQDEVDNKNEMSKAIKILNNVIFKEQEIPKRKTLI